MNAEEIPILYVKSPQKQHLKTLFRHLSMGTTAKSGTDHSGTELALVFILQVNAMYLCIQLGLEKDGFSSL